MTTIKNFTLAFSVLVSGMVFGQGFNSTIYKAQFIDDKIVPDSLAQEIILSPQEKIDAGIYSMISDPVLKNAKWGFMVYDPKTDKIISAYNECSPLIPASTTKLLTTETALNLLGENFMWTTQLEYSGEIDENGILNGNLYIVGSGDPSLGSGKAGAYSYYTLVSDFISALKSKGIKKVNGNIVIQTAFFKDNKRKILPKNIVWMDFGTYYLPTGTTENIDDSKEKSAMEQNSFSKTKNYFYVSTDEVLRTDEFSGEKFTTKLPDAPAYLANTMRTSMIKRGIGVSGKVVTKMQDLEPENREVLSTYKSPPLSEIVFYTNQHSDNDLAEATLKMVGFQKYGDQTLESGKKVVMEHLENISFDTDGFNYADGSGLSRNHSVSPYSQVKFLSSLMDEPYFKTYFDSLPIGGQTGTLKRMFLGNGNGHIFAKTGTLNKVKTLAGFLKTSTGKTLIFSVLINNYAGSNDQVKARIERLLEPVLEY
ncbi:MAG: D-alanyl-D-alanine carboxypeptidase/D-alanyl-D-alanine-endopeptidase [Flavobacteriaceae bacterium]|jgi:D-alanyl-D-alanine carboxypeptidase/D-alanyl-D-alanine-endopeptidase (penicillin-binding protein 4)|nr:D-alanyl-D-alanine carboxypeptidase/D-alanyl-D-alanine-endopeptidase [Flavobacteriaceae bacterium]